MQAPHAGALVCGPSYPLMSYPPMSYPPMSYPRMSYPLMSYPLIPSHSLTLPPPCPLVSSETGRGI